MNESLPLAPGEQPQKPGIPVKTACNGLTFYKPGMPSAAYRGQVIYFCLTECQEGFERDPATSCLASRLGEFEPEA